MKKNEPTLEVSSIQYVFNSEFEREWKSYVMSLLEQELYELISKEADEKSQ